MSDVLIYLRVGWDNLCVPVIYSSTHVFGGKVAGAFDSCGTRIIPLAAFTKIKTNGCQIEGFGETHIFASCGCDTSIASNTWFCMASCRMYIPYLRTKSDVAEFRECVSLFFIFIFGGLRIISIISINIRYQAGSNMTLNFRGGGGQQVINADLPRQNSHPYFETKTIGTYHI